MRTYAAYAFSAAARASASEANTGVELALGDMLGCPLGGTHPVSRSSNVAVTKTGPVRITTTVGHEGDPGHPQSTAGMTTSARKVGRTGREQAPPRTPVP